VFDGWKRTSRGNPAQRLDSIETGGAGFAKATPCSIRRCSPSASNGEWTQTKGSKNEIRWPFEIKITRKKTYIYQSIGKQAQELPQQGLSWVKVAQQLGISDKTAKKAATVT
jgi:hypothetical protein